MQIEILLFDGFDELDAFGPFEALADHHDVAFVTLAGARTVRSDRGVPIGAGRALSEHPGVLIVPGGGWFDRRTTTGAWAEAERGTLTAAIAARHAAGSMLASVCTGAMLLARAGVLAGRRATTNPQAIAELREFAGVEVVEARVVDGGDVITAGAPGCALELGLAVLERLSGAGVAAAQARELQLDAVPQPA